MADVDALWVAGNPQLPAGFSDWGTEVTSRLVGLGEVSVVKRVRVATTVAGILSTSFENGDTVDGVVLATGDRILIKNQAAGADNGIYTVNASGAPTRATDYNTSARVLANTLVVVSEGTANVDSLWQLTTNAPITLGTTALVFSPFHLEVFTEDVSGTAYTLVLADANKIKECSNAAAVTVTVPPNADVAFAIGAIVEIYAAGAGGVTIAAGSGVTIRNTRTLAQYKTGSLRKRATNEWVMI